jgi:hypothetical protein
LRCRTPRLAIEETSSYFVLWPDLNGAQTEHTTSHSRFDRRPICHIEILEVNCHRGTADVLIALEAREPLPMRTLDSFLFLGFSTIWESAFAQPTTPKGQQMAF